MHIVLKETSPLYRSGTARLAGELGMTYVATSNLVNRKPVASKTIAAVLHAFPSHSFEAQFEVVSTPPIVPSRPRGRPAVLDTAEQAKLITTVAAQVTGLPLDYPSALALAGDDPVVVDGLTCYFTHYPEGTDGLPVEHVELIYSTDWAVRYFTDGALQVNPKAPLTFLAPHMAVRGLTEIPTGGMLRP